jgi:hypothetical protein
LIVGLQARRRFPRAMLRGTIQVNVPGRRMTGELLMLSAGGMFVSRLSKLPVGSQYAAYLLLNGVSIPLQVTAKVLYHLPAMDGNDAGTGFAFTNINGESLRRVEETVKKAGELYQRLLFALTDENQDPAELEKMCKEAGLPEGLSTAQLRWHVVQGISRFRA